MKKLFFSTFIIVALLVMGGVCVAEDQSEFRIGIVGPFTGPSARIGQEIKSAIEMAFEDIGYKIGKYNINLIYIDSQSDPAKATNALEEAIARKKLHALHGGYHSSVTVADMDLAAKYKIPHYFSGGATPLIDEKWHSKPELYSGYLVGKDWPTPSKLMNGYMDALLNAEKQGLWKPKTRRVALYGEDTDWGRDVGKEFKRLFKQNGFEIAAEDYFNLTQTNFYALAGNYKKLDVDVIAGSSSGPASMAAFIKQVREVGVKATIIADGLGWTGEWYEMTGDASNYVLDMIPQLVTAESKAWAKKFEAKYGMKPSASAGGFKYDWAKFFIKCLNNILEQYGKLDSESLHKYAIAEVQTGKVSYTRDEGAIVHARYRYTEKTIPDPVVSQQDYYFPVIQYFEGKGTVVFPKNLKEKDIQFMQ